MHKKLLKVREKCAKYAKKCENAKECNKVRNANAMQKWNQNWHCIALYYCNKIFFVAFSHLF